VFALPPPRVPFFYGPLSGRCYRLPCSPAPLGVRAGYSVVVHLCLTFPYHFFAQNWCKGPRIHELTPTAEANIFSLSIVMFVLHSCPYFHKTPRIPCRRCCFSIVDFFPRLRRKLISRIVSSRVAIRITYMYPRVCKRTPNSSRAALIVNSPFLVFNTLYFQIL